MLPLITMNANSVNSAAPFDALKYSSSFERKFVIDILEINSFSIVLQNNQFYFDTYPFRAGSRKPNSQVTPNNTDKIKTFLVILKILDHLFFLLY